MDGMLIGLVASIIVFAIVGLVVVLPFSIIPRKPMTPDERSESAVNAAQNEAELLYRRQPPVG